MAPRVVSLPSGSPLLVSALGLERGPLHETPPGGTHRIAVKADQVAGERFGLDGRLPYLTLVK
jgi:hypothetical protein